MRIDTELEAWQGQWQRQPVSDIPPDLRRLVDRETRRMRLSFILPVLTTIGVGGLFTLPVIRSAGPDAIGLAAAVWLILAVAWAFVLWNNAGTWRPAAETTAAFLNVSVQRCRRALRGTVFGAALYVGELVFCFTWVLSHQSGRSRHTLASLLADWPFGVVVWLVTPLFFAFLVRHWRRRRSELRALERLGEQWMRE